MVLPVHTPPVYWSGAGTLRTLVLILRRPRDSLAWRLGALTLLFSSPLCAQTSPAGPSTGAKSNLSSFEMQFQQELASIANSPYCAAFGNKTQTLAEQQCALAGDFNPMTPMAGLELRAVAPNQLSAENSGFKDFAGGQFQNLAQRLSQLRAGTNGFLVGSPAAANTDYQEPSSTMPRSLGGGASADELFSGISRWGGFFNTTYDWGRREATDDENALRSHATEITLGGDYRIDRNLSFGAIASFADDDLSFNQNANVVGGSLGTKGYSLMIFAQQEWNHGYLGAAIGDQLISQNMTRSGIFIDPETSFQAPFMAVSSTKGRSLLGVLNAGFDQSINALTIETYTNVQYRGTRIDGFQERGANGSENNSVDPSWNINLRFTGQSVTSLQGTAGLKLQYALSSAFGVLTPFLDMGFVHEFNDSIFNVTGNFVALYGQSLSNGGPAVPNFVLLEDRPAMNFGTVAGGFVLVAKGRMQGYFRYRQVFGQRYITDQAVELGLRIAI